MKKAIQKLGPIEYHPYGPFIPPNAKSIIVGTFPIAKFTDQTKKFKENEIDFSYGGEKSQFWKLLSISFNRELKNKDQILNFLRDEGIAIGDVIKSCQRINGSSSDNHLRNCEYFISLREIIISNSISKIYFTSAKVKFLFQSKIGSVEGVEEILLISPSGSGVRQISNIYKDEYKKWKIMNSSGSPAEFRIYMYKTFFFKKL